MCIDKGSNRRNADRYRKGNKADLIEKEKQRLEVMKRRQERELSQVRPMPQER